MIKFTLHRVRSNRLNLAAILALCLFMRPDRASAQQHSLSLRQCISIALRESSLLKASDFDLLSLGAEIQAAERLNWPSLTASAGGEAFSGSSTGRFGIVSTTSPTGGGVNTNRKVDFAGIGIFGAKLQYPIFRDGSIFGLNDAPAVESKKAEQNALSWTTHLSREEVIYRVTDAFIATVSAQLRVEPIRCRVGLLEKSYGIVSERQEKGLLLPIDVKVIQDQLSGARSLATLVNQQAVAGSLELTRLLGLPSSSHIRLVNDLPTTPPAPSAAMVLAASLNHHPSLFVQRANIAKAKQDWRLERFRLYPTISLTGSALDVNDFERDAHVFSGGITVNVPIWDFGAQLATARAKQDKYYAEQARLNSVGDDVVNEVVLIYQEIASLSENILTLQGEVGKLDRDVRVATSQQQQGIADPLPTIDSELLLLGKQDALSVAEAKRLLLYAALQKASGGTWKWLK